MFVVRLILIYLNHWQSFLGSKSAPNKIDEDRWPFANFRDALEAYVSRMGNDCVIVATFKCFWFLVSFALGEEGHPVVVLLQLGFVVCLADVCT